MIELRKALADSTKDSLQRKMDALRKYDVTSKHNFLNLTFPFSDGEKAFPQNFRIVLQFIISGESSESTIRKILEKKNFFLCGTVTSIV